ncbi:MAG: LacI family DNA-binding transcriptional regulator, partial [Lautropia sp.]
MHSSPTKRPRARVAATPRQHAADAPVAAERPRPAWQPATQHDVARLAGVSQAAVSRWSSGRGYVASHVRQQIIDAAAALSYRPHPLAQGLSNGQSDMVAVVIANIANPGYQMMLERITQTLQSKGLQVLLFIAAPTQSVDDVVPDVLRYRVRGAIITTSRLSSTAARQLVERGVPVVLFHRYTRSGGMHTVVCDNRDGGRLAAEALLAAGARRPGFIGGSPDTSSNVDRRAGFLAELRRLSQPEPATLDGEFTYEWGFEAVQ